MTHSIESLLKLNIFKQIGKNIQTIEQINENSADIVKREFVFHGARNISGAVFYTDGLVNVQLIDQEVLKPLMIYSSQIEELGKQTLYQHQLADKLCENLLLNTSIKLVKTFEEVIENLLSGDTVLFLDHTDKAFIISTKGWDARSVDEPSSETVVRGPRDGFTENIRTNTALVRRRIRDPLLRVEGLKIGDKSKTDINIAYIKDTVKDGLVEEVKNRLQKIKIDGILESGYIEEFISDSPLSPFTTIQSTERPDKVTAAIFEGRVAIFVDNTPFVLIVPTYFWQFFQASDDYYSSYWVGSFFRLVRYIGFLISLTLPSFYVMLATFHQEMIPTALALTIAAGREAVPFPVLLEALIMEFAFELMREAGLRMPKPIGQAVSIVGSLVVGQAAVQAGLVSPFMVIVVATTGIASFTLPNYAASFSIRLLRFPLLIASGVLGILGFTFLFSLISIHALSLRSFGEPYAAPLFPLRPGDQKDIIVRMPWWTMDKNPQMAKGDLERQEDNQMPKPPNTNYYNQNNTVQGTKSKAKRNWRKK